MQMINIFLLLAGFSLAFATIFPRKEHKKKFLGWVEENEIVPFMAFITSSEFCKHYHPNAGGALISSRFVITSAAYIHECKGILTVKFGIRNAAKAKAQDAYKAKKIYYNSQNFDIREHYNDIGLIELEESVIFTDLVQPISLLSLNDMIDDRFADLTIYGYGRRREKHFLRYTNGILMHRSLKLDTTLTELQSQRLIFLNKLNQTYTCWGDSGDPIIMKGKLVGLVNIILGCEDDLYPSMFTGIAHYYHWIINIVGVNEMRNAKNYYRIHHFLS